MRKSILNVSSLLLFIVVFFSCQNDDDTVTDSTIVNDDGLNITSIIEAIASNESDGIWKAEQAEVRNSNGNVINITDSYIIDDDLFTFSEGSNQTLNLHWKKGIDINMQAENLQEAETDTNTSSEDIVLAINEDTGTLSSSDNRVIGNFVSESGEIFMTIEDITTGSTLSLTMAPKNATDFVKIPSTTSSPLELFSFDTGIARVGLKVSQSENSIYLTNRNDLVPNQQLAFKYDLGNRTLTSIDFLLSDFATKNIEFVEGAVLSLGGSRFQAFDYELTGVDTFIEIDPFSTLIFNGTASLNNTVYTFGNSNGNGNIISTWNIGNDNLQEIATLSAPSEIAFMDGEIIDQVLYIFGGWDTDFPGSDILHTYNIDTGIQNQIQLPVVFERTFTSTVENLIYIVGVEPFGSQSLDTVFGVYNTLDDSFQEINIDSLDAILTNSALQHFQVTGDRVYFVTSEDLEGSNDFTNRVYEAVLN